MSDFRKFLDEQLEDPELKAEWDALQPERALVQAMIDARKRTGLTQQQLAEKPASLNPTSANSKQAAAILPSRPCSVWRQAWE